jgi:fibronectin type 3 domain-containing protein
LEKTLLITVYNGKYSLRGASDTNYYVDSGAANGVLNYYAVTAYNDSGNESGLSKDIAYYEL